MLEDIDPFKSQLVSDKFRPFVTSSPRGSSTQVNASGSCDFVAVLKANASTEREGIYSVVNSPEFLSDEDNTGTLVNLLGDRSPAPKFLGSPIVKHIVGSGTINNKNSPSTSTPASCSVRMPGLAETEVLPHSQCPASVGGASVDSGASGPYISCPQHSSSNGRATKKGTQYDTPASPAFKEILLGSTPADMRTERSVRCISRDTVLNILKRGPRVHIRSLSSSHGPLEEVLTVPSRLVGAAGQANTMSDTEASVSLDRVARDSPLLKAVVHENASGLCSSLPPAGPIAVDIEKVRRKVVVKTRLFKDAYKRATTGLRPEKV
jgi:hypothetical protein